MSFDGIAAIRRRPDMYLPAVTLECIGACLVDDARLIGATQVRIDTVEDWHIISADIDWLRLPLERVPPFDRLFTGRHIHPTRINGIRAEVLVGAFARSAYVATPHERQCVVGNAPLPASVSNALCQTPCVRSVAFTVRGD